MIINTIYNGDCFDLIKTIPSDFVQAIITSPPYWGLRDYGVDGQLGLEENFTDYINKLVSFFEDTKRVLKSDGILYVNIGDTYYGGGNNRGNTKEISNKQKGNRGGQGQVNLKFDYSLCPRKSLTGIPQRFMIAMIDKGWICRNQIIWVKPNAMPTSVKDRFSQDYEVIYMFSKNPIYKFNQMKEPMKTNDLSRPRGSKGSLSQNSGLRGCKSTKEQLMRNMRTTWKINTKPIKEAHFATFPEELVERMLLSSTNENDIVLDPFMGSGTVAKVSMDKKRNYIGFELNQKYIEIAEARIKKISKQETFDQDIL